MLTKDDGGKFWHRGTKIGMVYATIALLLFIVTMTEDKTDRPLYWLPKLGLFFVILPLSAASQAYVSGDRDGAKLQSANPIANDRHV